MDQDDRALTSEQLTITLPPNLLAQIDAQVGGGFVDRQDFIRSAVRRYVEYIQESRRSTDAAG